MISFLFITVDALKGEGDIKRGAHIEYNNDGLIVKKNTRVERAFRFFFLSLCLFFL